MKRIVLLLLAALLAACQTPDTKISSPGGGKVVVYQVFTRLFGNTHTTYKPWGTPEENGVGKMNDFTDAENCFYSFYYSGETVSLQANLNSAK